MSTLQSHKTGGHRIDAEAAAGGQLVTAFSENQRGEVLETDYAHPLTAGGGKPGQGYPAARTAAGVRRLLPVETERLQGFPTFYDWSEDMTRDEFAAALLESDAIMVDCRKGEVYAQRGPGGKWLDQPRLIAHRLPSGYLVGSFKIGEQRKQLRLHRVVWIAWHGVPPAGMAVCHRNNDKTDNRIENLYLATSKQNSSDAARDGLYRNASKIDAEAVRRLTDDYRRGEGTLRALAAKYGISKSRAHQLIHKTEWTAIPGAPDSRRYAAMGDAVTVPVIEWIGRRLLAEMTRNDEEAA